MEFKTVIQHYNNFFFRKIPATSLGLFRIFFATALLLNALLLYPDLKTWFSETGVLPYQVARDTLPGTRINVFTLLPVTEEALYSVYAVYIVSILLLLVGLFTRTVTAIVFVLTVSFSHRNVFILNSGDTMARCLLFFMLFAPSGKTFSFDRLIKVFRRKEEKDSALFVAWPQRMMQYQVAIMYIATVVWKLRGDMWVDGTSVYMTSRLDEFKRFPMPKFSQSLWYSRIATYYALFVEFAMGVLVWLKEFHYPVLIMGVCLHLGLEYAMNVPVFQWVTLSTYILFVEHEKLIQIRNYLMKFLPAPITVFYDGDCGFCMRNVEVVEHLDLFKRVQFQNFRSKETKKIANFPFERAETEVVMKVGGNWIGGYDVFRLIFKRLPLTALIWPLLYVPPVPQIGRRVYRWVAKNRHILSHKLMSKDSICELD